MEQSRRPTIYEESIGLAATIARIPIANVLAKRIRNKTSINGPLSLFVITDIADGWVARKLDADTPIRRALDAIVDRSSVVMAGSEMWRQNRTARPFLAMLAAREAFVTSANAYHLAKTGEVVHGTGAHKLSSLSVAAFALGSSTHDKLATVVSGTIAVTINYGLAVSYLANVVHPFGCVEDGVRHIGAIPSFSSASE